MHLSSSITITVNAAVVLLPPVTNATANPIQVQLPVDTLNLYGSASSPNAGGSIVSYQWYKVSGATATLATPTALNTKVTLSTAGSYTFGFIATDNTGLKDTSFVTISEVAAINQPPVVNAGNDTTTTTTTTSVINLNGTATDPEGGTVTTLWTVDSTACAIVSPTSLNTTATCNPGVYTFTLQGTDSVGASSFDQKIATINLVGSCTPVVIANPDFTLQMPKDSVILNDTATCAGDSIVKLISTIVSSIYPVTLTKTATYHPIVHFTSTLADTIKIKFVAVNSVGTRGRDTTTIITIPPIQTNHPPVIVTATSYTIYLPQTDLIMYADKSYDPDGDQITFLWTQIFGTTILPINMSANTNNYLYIKNLTVGTYKYLLTVTDSKGLASSVTITITVKKATKYKAG